MKPFVGWTLAAAALLAAVPLGSLAQGRDRGYDRGWRGDTRQFERHDQLRWSSGAWRHGSHSGLRGWWWVIGGMWYLYPQPVYPYPDPNNPPPLMIEQSPPVYVPAPSPMPGQPSPGIPPVVTLQPSAPFWYYCDAAQGYYPYVTSCPTGWRTVPANQSEFRP